MADNKLRVRRFTALVGFGLWVAMVILTGCVPVGLGGRTTPVAQVQSADPAGVLEERYGIRIVLLGLTAVGSAVDFQYMVTDVDKATQWLHDEELMPTLVDEDSGAQMHHPPAMMHNMNHEVGRVYHMLLPNTGNAIKRGDRVSILIGDLRLDPITAQ